DKTQNISRMSSRINGILLILKELIGELDSAKERQPFHGLRVLSLHPMNEGVGRLRSESAEAIGNRQHRWVTTDPRDDPAEGIRFRKTMVGHGLPVKLREQTEDPRVRRDDLVKMTLAKDGLAMKQFERKCFVIS